MTSGALPHIGFVWLGRRGYREMLAVQEGLVSARQRGDNGDLLLLLEHPPVYSLGRRTEPDDLRHDRTFYREHGIAIEETPRGGKVTYHGPGQLVAYPILDLRGVGPQPGGAGRIGIARFVEILETATIGTLRRWQVDAGRIEGLTGLWVDRAGSLPGDADAASTAAGVASGRIRKIGSIGLKVSRGVTSHGLAINVDGDLAPFGWINSCGIEHCAVTSVKAETEPTEPPAGDPDRTDASTRPVPSTEQLGVALAEELAGLLGRGLIPVDPATIGL